MISKNVVDLRGRRTAPGPRGSFVARVAREEPQFGRRQSALRARRRRARMIAIPIVLVCAAALVWGVHVLTYMPRFAIREIRIEGARALPSALVRSFVAAYLDDGSRPFLSRASFLTYDADALGAAVERFFPRVRAARVQGGGSAAGAITVTIEEREPYALWCADETHADCYAMDDGGFVFASSRFVASSTIASPYAFGGGLSADASPIGQRYIPAHVPGLVAFMKSLASEGFSPTGAVVENDQDFSVQLDDGFVVEARFGDNAEDLTRDLKLILASDALVGRAQDLQYVDLRFGNRVYYKMDETIGAASSTRR